MNLNDSSHYIGGNTSTSIPLIPISNNASVVSSNKTPVQKATTTTKHWRGSVSENLHQHTTSNTMQSPPTSAAGYNRIYPPNYIPPLNNPPVSSLNAPLGQRQSGVTSLDKKLNENHLVNNNAKIMAYVINSAYSNAIVTPSGTNPIKEKLSAMAYMNEDNVELDNPLNIMPSGRRKSNTSVPSTAVKSTTHQSSQSINFSLSKRKINEKLNEYT